MAKLKKSGKGKLNKKENPTTQEELVKEEVSEEPEVPVAEEPKENGNINEAEEKALAEQEENTDTVQTDKLNKALKVLHDTFNLHGYTVMSFKDEGSKVTVSVTNGDFDLTIKIRDCENYGIY